MKRSPKAPAWTGALNCALLASALLLSPVLLAAEEARKPLLMEGKKTLYQRILTRPGATLVAKPGEGGGKAQPAFSQLYVYERQTQEGRDWLLVGGGSRGKTDGWLEVAQTLPWRQQMALAFTNPANRDRALLFKERKDLVDLLKADDPPAALAPIRAAVEADKGDARVLSIEPKEYIDISKRFYLLPILQAEELVTPRGTSRVLEVASLSLKGDPTPPAGQAAKPKAQAQEVLRNFSAAVVFVIDATISMGPYIERTRAAVRRIYDKVEQAGLGGQVKFGLVAYRSSVKAVPELEYVSKMFADPTQVKGGQDFLERVKGLSPAKVSSPRFEEDAFAGILTALQGVDWSQFGGRYLVLISDAGAIRGASEFSSTQLDAEQVRIEAAQSGVALYGLHLKTPAGKANHGEAERQYRTLTHNEVLGKPLYYGVDAGSVDQFGQIVDSLAEAIVDQVQAASQGKMVPGSARTAKPPEKPKEVPAQVQDDARLLGHAMQLAYLGRVQGTRAPDLFQAWLSDRDFAKPDLATTEVRVLLTKNQLSNLRDVVKAILEAGDRAQQDVGTADFFDLLRSSAAQLARDPAKLGDPAAAKLGELGLLGEYLDDLPYRSQVMSLTSATWQTWSLDQQEEFLDGLRRKLRHYQLYHDDADRWIALSPSADPADRVYPVPIEALP